MMPPEQVVVFIIGTIVILFGAYYVTYFIGMKASGQKFSGLRNRNISLLDRYAIARDKSFCVVEIAGKVYFIGVTNHSMTLLDTIDSAEFEKLTEANRDNTPWNKTPVGQYGNKLTQKLVAFIAEKTGRVLPGSSESGENDFSETLKEAQRKTDEKEDDDPKNPNNPED